MSERIKIEDLTLSQIKVLKNETAKIISQCIADTIGVLNERYDVGLTDVEVHTDVDTLRTVTGEELSQLIEYKVSVKFSREDL